MLKELESQKRLLTKEKVALERAITEKKSAWAAAKKAIQHTDTPAAMRSESAAMLAQNDEQVVDEDDQPLDEEGDE